MYSYRRKKTVYQLSFTIMFLHLNSACTWPNYQLKSLLASSDICQLLIIFAKNLDPDQARQNVGPDLSGLI